MPRTLFERLFGGSGPLQSAQVRLFIETMLIMIAADGVVEESELDLFVRQVRTRPEFDGLPQRALDTHVQAAFADIRRDGVDARIKEIALGLANEQQRLTAFTMATTIAAGDGGIAASESEQLEKMRGVFGITASDAQQVQQAVLEGRTPELLAMGARREQPEQLYIEVLLLMAAADGVMEASEMDRFGHQLAERSEFASMTPELASKFLDFALRNLEQEGVEARVQAIADGLSQGPQRLSAFRMALEMSLADGGTDSNERALLKMLQSSFALSDEQVRGVIAQVTQS